MIAILSIDQPLKRLDIVIPVPVYELNVLDVTNNIFGYLLDVIIDTKRF